MRATMSQRSEAGDEKCENAARAAWQTMTGRLCVCLALRVGAAEDDADDEDLAEEHVTKVRR